MEINQDGEEVEIVGESTTEITSKVLQCQSFPEMVPKKATLKAHLHPRLIVVICFCFESLYCPNA